MPELSSLTLFADPLVSGLVLGRVPVVLREVSVNIGTYKFLTIHKMDELAAALIFALAASAARCSALTLSSSAFWLLLCSILFFLRSASSSRTLFFRYSVSSCGLFIDGCFKDGTTDEILLNKIVCDQGFICGCDYFINHNHAFDQDVFFGIGEVEHKGIHPTCCIPMLSRLWTKIPSKWDSKGHDFSVTF